MGQRQARKDVSVPGEGLLGGELGEGASGQNYTLPYLGGIDGIQRDTDSV